MNNEIISVSRELLELALEQLEGNWSWIDELRALLAKPAEEQGSSHGFEQSPNTCRHDERSGVWWREGSTMRTGRECCACGSVDEDPAAPSAQPQGEPVAWRVTGRGGLTVTPEYPKWAVGERGLTITPLYAEQPAPIAVVLPARKPDPSCMTTVDDDREAAIWNACIEATARLNPGAKP